MAEKELPEKIQKKLKEGWIQSWMMIEVLAATKEAAKSALEKHVAMLEKEEKAVVYRKDFKKIDKIKQPFRGIEEAYSNVVELEMVTENYEKLVFLVMNYAPSSIEILNPESIKMDVGEAQGILNSISEMMHKFAAAGLGGVVVKT